MNVALCRGAWDKGRTDIMYMTIVYPNYPIISLLTQPRRNCVNMLWLWNSSLHFGTWTRILSTATQCVTIELLYLIFRYGCAETITKYWSCLICAKELKCQKGIIIQHLLNVHTLVSGGSLLVEKLFYSLFVCVWFTPLLSRDHVTLYKI